MNNVVLALKDLTITELIAELRRVSQGLADNAAAFTGVDPTAAELATVADTLEGKTSTAAQRAQAAEAATLDRDNTVTAASAMLTQTATCDVVKALAPEVCALVFTLKSAPVATTSMPKVTTVTVSFGDKTTELDIMWAPIAKSRAFEIQFKTATGVWTPAKTTTRSSTTIEGLPAGVLVQIRIRVIGPNELTGEWSDPIEHLVP